ncbi:MFS transporter, partial [Gordonibacter sp.]|uniref:MFS transporter n=1 Tax=Gordonibacter sp. TaxID=1968902 RepID=UPI002FCA798C
CSSLRYTESLGFIGSDTRVGSEAHMGAKKPKGTLWTKDFVLITVVNLLIFSSWQAFPFVLPVYMQSLGAPDAVLGLVTAVTTVSALLIRPFCGMILDRFGRKGIFLSGIVFMGLASICFEFIPMVGAILALRFVHGLAWGITSTSSQTVATDIIPPKRFGEGMGLFALSASLALAIAPGLALELFDWQGITPVIILAVGTLVLAFAFASFLRYRPIERHPTFSMRNLIERSSVLPSVIVFFLTACYGALVTFLAIHASAQGVNNIAPFFTAYAIAVALSRPLLGKMVDHRGYALVLVPGLLLMIAALVLLSKADSLTLFVLTAFLYGAGFAACHSTLQTMAVANVEPQHRGAANATFLIGFDSGIGVGSAVSGLIVAVLGYADMYLCFAVLPLVSAAIFFAFARHRKPPRLANETEETHT